MVLWKSVYALNQRQGVAWAAAFLGTLGSISVFCTELGFSSALSAVPVGIASASIAAVNFLLLLLWSDVYSKMSVPMTSVALSGSYVVGAVLYFVLTRLPFELYSGIASVLPIMSAGCLTIGYAKVADGQPVVRRGGETNRFSWKGFGLPFKTVPWRIVAVVAAFSFAAGFNRSYTSSETDLFSAGVAGCVMLFLALFLSRRFSVFVVYKIALPVMMLGLVVGMVAGEASLFSQVCMNASYAFAMMMLVLLLCDRAYRFGAPAIFLNAVGRACVGLALALGMTFGGFLARVLGPSSVGHGVVVYAVTIAFVMIATFFWLSNRRMVEELTDHGDGRDKFVVASEDLEGGAPSSGSEARTLLQTILEDRCSQLSQEYRLSKRESEVLLLLAWGKSVSGIEKALTISANTVKTHVRNIYSKMGIHSRIELETLLGIGEER